MKTLVSTEYTLHAGEGAGRGTYIITRRSDGACTMRNTGIDAAIEYASFLKAYGTPEFDALCAQQVFDMDAKGNLHLPVRFFRYNEDLNDGEGDIEECSEYDFMNATGPIQYERHTVYSNGVAQICLTKMPNG